MPLFPVGTEIPGYYTTPQWFIGRVKYCHEHKAAGMLEALGVKFFLAEQTVNRKWSDRIKKSKVLLLPRYIFIRCLNSKRVEILQRIPSITHFMTDHETGLAAVIRDEDLETFREMVENVERPVTVSPVQLSAGDRVRVKQGILKGRECILTEIAGKKCYAVGLGILGSASVELQLSDLELIEEENIEEEVTNN